MPDEFPLFRLACAVQNYPTGVKGKQSLVAKCAAASPENGFQTKEDEYYAELWMGSAHPNGPSKLIDSSGQLLDLKQYVLDNAEKVYGPALEKFKQSATKHGQIPFLFKVLCAGSALALQIHPDKALAEQLYHNDPNFDMPDDNHKPEIALALGPFESFCGFKPFAHIQSAVKHVPEFRKAIGEEYAHKLVYARPKDGKAAELAVRAALAQLLKKGQSDSTKGEVAEQVKSLASRCKESGAAVFQQVEGIDAENIAKAFPLLNEDYPGDVGAFVCALMMNYFNMKAGECIYVPAATIHAWFRGDIIECMANSDQVLNVAFTESDEKTIDVFTSNMITQVKTSKSEFDLPPKAFERSSSSKTTLYDPPFKEFSILRTQLSGGSQDTVGSLKGPTVFIALKSDVEVQAKYEGQEATLTAKEGQVFFAVAGMDITFKSQADAEIYTCIAE